MVEVIWKMITTIINNHLRTAIYLHDTPNGFRQGRGAVMAAFESKLAHQLLGICHKPLFRIRFDVKKSYDSLGQKRYIEILWGYIFGKDLQRILQRFLGGSDGSPKGWGMIWPPV